jgi:hypothetical protein
MNLSNKGRLSGDGFIVGFDHILERFKAGAALGFVAAGAGRIDLGHAAFRAVLRGQVLAHFLVAERVAETDHHDKNPDPKGAENDSQFLLRIIIS